MNFIMDKTLKKIWQHRPENINDLKKYRGSTLSRSAVPKEMHKKFQFHFYPWSYKSVERAYEILHEANFLTVDSLDTLHAVVLNKSRRGTFITRALLLASIN
uniref:Uncharacterized protein n=1 Tax=Cacopsylla melanoneura TaxID=428564 RepID=A0A8D8Z654_9HEMI